MDISCFSFFDIRPSPLINRTANWLEENTDIRGIYLCAVKTDSESEILNILYDF